MSCSDILLTFLDEMNDDWSSNFQFSEFCADDIDLTDYMTAPPKPFVGTDTNKKTSYQTAFGASCGSDSGSSSPAYSNYTSSEDSDGEDEMIRNLCAEVCADGWDWDTEDISNPVVPVVSASTPVVFKTEQSHFASVQAQKCANKKRKAETPAPKERETIETKKAKQTPEEKVVCIVSMLRSIKKKSSVLVADSYREPDPQGAAENLLRSIIGSKTSNAQELMGIFAPTGVLNCKSISSLFSEAQSKRNKMNLSAWMPAKYSVQNFPSQHKGVGQISGAARTFVSSMCDLLPARIVSKVQFSTSLSSESVIVSAGGDQLAANFTWRSVGLVAQGIKNELEFNGLIRCTFGKDGVSNATISFDVCKPVRECASL